MQAASSFPLIAATHEYLPFRGGVAVYVHEVAVAARTLGRSLEIWTADRGGVKAGAATGEMKVVRFASDGRLTPRGLGALAWGWWRRRRELRARTTLLMSVGAQMIFFWFDLLGVVPARRTLVLFYGSELLRFRRDPVWRWLARRYYARAGGFAAISRYTAGLARESGLLPAGAEVTVAPCALPEAFATRVLPAVETDETTWRVLTVARLHPRKGQREVARALAALPADVKARTVYQVVGVGDAAYRAEVEEVCRAGGVRCEFLGGLDDRALGETYARCTLYAQASVTLARSVEGFGLSFLEAGFYGKPSAGFLSGGVAEAVVDGQTGLLVPEGDVLALTAAIGQLLGDRVLREQMGAAGREYARSLRWEDAARALFDAAGKIESAHRAAGASKTDR